MVLLRILQEVDDLTELLHGLVDAGHVLERGLHLLAVVDLDPVAPQVQRGGGPGAGHPAQEEEPQEPEDAGVEQDLDQDARERVRLDALRRDAPAGQVVQDLRGLVVAGDRGGQLLAGGLADPRDRGVGHLGRLDHAPPVRVARLEVGHEGGVGRAGVRPEEQALDQQQHQQRADDVDQREAPRAPLAGLWLLAASAQVEPGPPSPALPVVIIGHVVSPIHPRSVEATAPNGPPPCPYGTSSHRMGRTGGNG